VVDSVPCVKTLSRAHHPRFHIAPLKEKYCATSVFVLPKSLTNLLQMLLGIHRTPIGMPQWWCKVSAVLPVINKIRENIKVLDRPNRNRNAKKTHWLERYYSFLKLMFELTVKRTHYGNNRHDQAAKAGMIMLMTDLLLHSERGPRGVTQWIGSICSCFQESLIKGAAIGGIALRYIRGSNLLALRSMEGRSIWATAKRGLPAIVSRSLKNDALEKSLKCLTQPSATINPKELRDVTDYVIRTMTRLGKDIPVGLSSFSSTSSCVERTRSAGGAYEHLRDGMIAKKQAKMDELLSQIKGAKKVKINFPDADSYYTYDPETINARQVEWNAHIMDEASKITDPMVSLMAIPEKGGKIRVAGLTNAAFAGALSPLADQALGIIKRHPALKGAFESKPLDVLKRFSTKKFLMEKDGRRFVSVDMEEATNNINHNFAVAVIEGLATSLRWTNSQKQIAIASIRNITAYFTDRRGLSQHVRCTSGTHMGLPLSFVILCLSHLWCAKALGHKRFVIFGDDAAMLATKEEYKAYLERIRITGMVVNKTKTDTSDFGFIFCGQFYRVHGRKLFDHLRVDANAPDALMKFRAFTTKWALTHVPTLKVSAVTGSSSEVQKWTSVLDSTQQTFGNGGRTWALKRGQKYLAQHQLKGLFTIATKLRIDPYGPRELFGLGIPALGRRYDKLTRYAAAGMFRNNKSWKDGSAKYNELERASHMRFAKGLIRTSQLPNHLRQVIGEINGRGIELRGNHSSPNGVKYSDTLELAERTATSSVAIDYLWDKRPGIIQQRILNVMKTMANAKKRYCRKAWYQHSRPMGKGTITFYIKKEDSTRVSIPAAVDFNLPYTAATLDYNGNVVKAGAAKITHYLRVAPEAMNNMAQA